MDKIYYQPNHLWKGQKAVKKLKELSGEKPKAVKQWLSRQAFWQVHLPAPKHVDRPHYEVTIPNEVHQFDLLYMPSDSLYGSKYKYILVGIDAASDIESRGLWELNRQEMWLKWLLIFTRLDYLNSPKIFQCDNGSEFKGDVTKMLDKNEVKIWRVTMKYKHTHTAFVEALNKILTERLFKVQDAQELNDPEKVLSRWVKHLYGLVDELNDKETEMIGMKPNDAIKLKEVPLLNREACPPEEVLPEDGLYWYLLQPSEEHNNQRCRATDRIWSKASYRLREITENPGNRLMYYLTDEPERVFVLEELILIPQDTELPPDYVQEW